ncbi:hypothetical protein QAD02_020066 [Eretmocerus hayati]|uniref:Uncharacterized protein n=1 Tax=Eretmocerus hayati TaxID=131215 RepID=A0ACC2PNV4_9HYME|nr:hypothetical protein QAD02_020066 [Eretmocerus hayati]
MDESWYVTPPACFTQPGPVHVESSPLEDLLIEHPSMSVYRAAGPKQLNSRKHRPKQSARVKHQQQKLQVIPIGPVPNPIVAPSPAPVVALAPVPEAVTRPKPAPAPQPLALVVATTAPVLVPQQPQQQQQVLAPIVARKRRTRITRPSATLQHRPQQQVHQSPRRALGDLQADSLHESDYVIDSFYREAMAQICRREDREMRQRGLRRATQRHHQQQRQRARDADATNGGQMMLQADDVLRRAGLRETRPIRGDENFHIVHVRSAQKALEKYSSQSSKRNCLERGNKVREVSSGKRRCPRRQDRLRLNNSNANNNRKC